MVTKNIGLWYLIGRVKLYVLYLIFLLLAIDDVEPPNYKNVEEGKSIDVECGRTEIAHGENVTWSKSKKRNLESFQRFTVNNIGSLHIKDTKKTDIGFYTCARTTTEYGKCRTYFVNMYLNVISKYNSLWMKNQKMPKSRNFISRTDLWKSKEK